MSFLRTCIAKCNRSDNHEEYRIENIINDNSDPCDESRTHENVISNFPELETGDTPIDKENKATESKTDEEAWLTRMFRRTSTLVRNSFISNQSAGKRWRSFIRKKILTKLQTDPFVGNFLTDLENIPHTILIKATFDDNKECLANYHIQLENVPFCKECDVTFDNTDQLLSTLMTTKTEKVFSAENNEEVECFRCKICNSTISDEESYKNHLLKHIESQEVICEECEERASESPDENWLEKKIALPDRNLKKVRLLRVIASCRLCGKITLAKLTTLPEVMTVDQYDLCESENKKKYSCSECFCDLSSHPSFQDVKENIIVPRKPLCEKCSQDDSFETFVSDRTTKVRNSWIVPLEDCPMSEMFPKRYPPSRRHIFLREKDKSIKIKISEFIIEDTINDDDTWFICRICGHPSKVKEEIITHVLYHISFKEICDECESKKS